MKNLILIFIFLFTATVMKAQSVKNDSPKLLNAEPIHNNGKKNSDKILSSSIKPSETSENENLIVNDSLKRELQNSSINKKDSLIKDEMLIKIDH